MSRSILTCMGEQEVYMHIRSQNLKLNHSFTMTFRQLTRYIDLDVCNHYSQNSSVWPPGVTDKFLCMASRCHRWIPLYGLSVSPINYSKFTNLHNHCCSITLFSFVFNNSNQYSFTCSYLGNNKMWSSELLQIIREIWITTQALHQMFFNTGIIGWFFGQ
jgi:hypothetical protein